MAVGLKEGGSEKSENHQIHRKSQKSIFLKVVPTSIPDLLPRPARSRGGCFECLGVAKVLQVRRAEASMSTCGRGGSQVTKNPENHENQQKYQKNDFSQSYSSIDSRPSPAPCAAPGRLFQVPRRREGLRVRRAEASMLPCWGEGPLIKKS